MKKKRGLEKQYRRFMLESKDEEGKNEKQEKEEQREGSLSSNGGGSHLGNHSQLLQEQLYMFLSLPHLHGLSFHSHSSTTLN